MLVENHEITMDLKTRAAAFAAIAHNGQVRKNKAKTPYVEHTKAVAALVEAVGLPEEAVAAAHLHDTIEDTGRTYTELAGAFGRRVADLVLEVTRDMSLKGTKHEDHIHVDHEHFAKASFLGKSIKLADVSHNLSDLIELFDENPKWTKRYLSEAEELLPKLKGGHIKLYKLAEQKIANARKVIGS